MKPIELEKVRKFERELSNIVTSDMDDLNTDYLEKMNWVIIPIEEGPFYPYIENKSLSKESKHERDYEEDSFRIDMSSFVTTLKKTGYQSLYILSSISLTEPDCYIEVELTEKDISNVMTKCFYAYYAFFPKDFSFTILYVNDYSLVAGKKEFIESIIECDLETAMNAFKKDAATGWTEYAKESGYTEMKALLKHYEKYKAHNEKVLKALEGKEP